MSNETRFLEIALLCLAIDCGATTNALIKSVSDLEVAYTRCSLFLSENLKKSELELCW